MLSRGGRRVGLLRVPMQRCWSFLNCIGLVVWVGGDEGGVGAAGFFYLQDVRIGAEIALKSSGVEELWDQAAIRHGW